MENNSISVEGLGDVPVVGAVDCNDYNTYTIDVSKWGIIAWVEGEPWNGFTTSTLVDSKIKTVAEAKHALELVAKNPWRVCDTPGNESIACAREDLKLAQDYLALIQNLDSV